MRIIFDLRSTGCGSNGGTATIVKSANTLHKIGHKICIIDSGKNQYTWGPLLVPHIIPKRDKDIPDADAIIATGYHSVKHTVAAPDRCGVKLHYMRGWELWQMSEEKIVDKVLNQPTVKIVNSYCLQDKLKRYNINSYIIRPGYDFGEVHPLNTRRENNGKLILGGLFNKGAKRSGKRTDWIFETTRFLKKNYSVVELYMFGIDGHPNNELVDVYLMNPSIEEKNKLYNEVDIFLTPTMLEGLHLVGAEAMLTEATVVGTNAPMSGMQDYLIHNKTGLVSDNNQGSFIDAVRELIHQPELRVKLGRAGREKILSLGSRQDNMRKFIKIIENECF